ncbi:MAG: anhydro-N-acetylmuramic acid kinase, partial [Planctomycetota bacterium]|nr:anhydro-N-acetylmuramic acid kinase [Planctomycetota bacterium]
TGLDYGLGLRGLTTRLADRQICRVKVLGVESDALAPAAAAILALLHLDQVPANVAGITGAEVPRILGRLTPGGPQAWQRLLAACASGGAGVRPLRAAL